MASRQPEASRRGLRVQARLAPAVVTGDPSLAESLVANLVDNAVVHDVAGGHVRVVTAAPGGRGCLSASSSGPVIPPGQVGPLLEPFRKLDSERTRHRGGHI